ncbi:LysE family translocator [Jannaschia pagri]|uniref:LysE family translocator n=1 Tax=Jannaschia TaxID=188905 RepID=UPI0035712B53
MAFPVDAATLLAFVPATLALILTPGADMMFALAQGLRGGGRAGVAAAAGVATGGMITVTLAGLGLGAVVAAFPGAFGAIRWIGAAYLLWLAWKTLRTPLTGVPGGGAASRKAFRDGMIVNLSNPAVILFVLAYIPQFVDPSRAILPQFLVLGGMIAIGGFLVKSAVGIGAGRLSVLLTTAPALERGLRWASASIFGFLALRVARP